jgi:hypothetical protein
MRAAQFLAIIGRGSKGSNALEVTEDRAGATSEQQDNVINTVNSLDPYGPSWQLVPGNVAAGTVYAQVPTSGTGDLAFTRASTKTRTNAAGTVVNVASGVAAIDYRNADGSLSSTGRLLLEPQRTNSIRNSSMVGAVAGSSGTLPTNWSVNTGTGLTQTVVGIGTENGVPYIDLRYNGTAIGTANQISFEASNFIAATNNQAWAGSFWFKIISAPTPPTSYVIRFREATAAGTFVAEGSQAFTPTATLQRFTYVRTNTGATTERIQPMIQLGQVNGATYDYTIRIAAPQMELGAYATTFIPTTTAAVTRVIDNGQLSNVYTNGLISAAGGTWFIDLANNTSVTRDSASGGFYINTGGVSTSGDGITFRSIGNPSRLQIAKVVANSSTTIYTTTGDSEKIAIKWNGATADVFANGVKVVTATSFTPTTMQNLIANGNNRFININQSALFPVPMTDEKCIEMTTL